MTKKLCVGNGSIKFNPRISVEENARNLMDACQADDYDDSLHCYPNDWIPEGYWVRFGSLFTGTCYWIEEVDENDNLIERTFNQNPFGDLSCCE